MTLLRWSAAVFTRPCLIVRRSVLQNGTLAITAARASDQGDYQCEVKLAQGGVLLSRSAQLQLAGEARPGTPSRLSQSRHFSRDCAFATDERPELQAKPGVQARDHLPKLDTLQSIRGFALGQCQFPTFSASI